MEWFFNDATAPYQCYYIKVNSETNVAFKITLRAGKKTLYMEANNLLLV